MNYSPTRNRNFETVAWGAFFVWWGITEMFPSLPNGTGAIGIGLILLGLNGFRSLNGIAMSSFSTTLGIIALVLGGLELAQPLLHLPFELPVFGILLVVLGGIFVTRELRQLKTE